MELIAEEYKHTEVGLIPVDWEVKSCSDLCIKIQDGTHFSPTVGGNDYLYITSKNIKFGFLDIRNVDRIDSIQHNQIYKRCDVKFGDLLLTKDGANTGNAALNTIYEEFSLLSSVAFLRFDTAEYNAEYFLQHILSYFGQQQVKEAMTGNAITRLTLAKIKKLRFPVTTPFEQTAIATALSDADALISSLEKLIVKKRHIKQGAIQKLLEPKEGWKVKKLGEIFIITAGGDLDIKTFSQTQDSKYCYPVYSNSLANAGVYGFTSEFQQFENTITVTARGKVGVAHPRNHKYTAIGRVVMLNPLNELNINFVAEYINNFIEFSNESTGVPQLTVPQISKHGITLPPPKEQTCIANTLSDMDSEINALETKLEKYRNVKLGMMQNLLTGKIRLV